MDTPIIATIQIGKDVRSMIINDILSGSRFMFQRKLIVKPLAVLEHLNHKLRLNAFLKLGKVA